MLSRFLLVSLLTIARAGTPDDFIFLVHDRECTESRSMQEYYDEVLQHLDLPVPPVLESNSRINWPSMDLALEPFEPTISQDMLPFAKVHLNDLLTGGTSSPMFDLIARILRAAHPPEDYEKYLSELVAIVETEDYKNNMYDAIIGYNMTPLRHLFAAVIGVCHNLEAEQKSRLSTMMPEKDLTVPLKDLSPQTRRDVVITMLEHLVQRSGDNTVVAGALSIDYLPKLNIDIIDASRRLSKKSVSLLMENLPCVLHPVESNFERHISATPNDEYYAQQWHLHKDDYGANVAGAWECSQSGKNRVLMAHVDTGCALHPDLDPNLCKCDQACSSYDATAGDNPFIDKNGHGTMVASVFAAKSNNGYRHAGISGDSKVMCIKVDDNQGKIYFSSIAKAADYMLERNVKLVNFSLTGFGRSTTEKHVFQRLENEGVLVITAAGNFGDSRINSGCNIDAGGIVKTCSDKDGNKLDGTFPAAYGLKNVIVVAASDKKGQAWTGSNYGSKSVDLFAPGVKINVLHPSSTLDAVPFTERNGTSFAAAMVTGTILELLRHDPTLSVMEAKDLVLDTTKKMEHLVGLCKTGGILDAHAAMVALSKRKPCTKGSFHVIPIPTAEKIKAYEESQCFSKPTPGYLPQYDCEVDEDWCYSYGKKFSSGEQSSSESSSESSSSGLIAGIVIGGLGAFALLAAGGSLLLSKKDCPKKKGCSEDGDSKNSRRRLEIDVVRPTQWCADAYKFCLAKLIFFGAGM